MGRVFKWLGGIVVVLVVAGAILYFTGSVFPIMVWLSKPSHGWEPARHVAPPDYALSDAWAARPDKESPAKFVPAGVDNAPGERAVDVFFIHPTGYINGWDWNSPLNPKSRTEENTEWMLANQASAFSGCCDVYAPRYREASIFRFLSAPPDIAEKAMDLAYGDVVRAFQYYLDHENKGRPFIIASHSQGTWHGFRLIKEHIDGTPLQGRMIAAYLIGGQIKNAEVDALHTVHVCGNESETGCLVHWATIGDGGKVDPQFMSNLVCVNPLSWKRDGVRAEKELHQGGVPVSGPFSLKMWGDDAPQGAVFKPLAAPVRQWTWAECRAGILTVADQSSGPFAGYDFGAKNYHGLDYPLFHMDIRENARARVAAYLKAAVQSAAGGGTTPEAAPMPY